jgi:beta-lactamase class A
MRVLRLSLLTSTVVLLFACTDKKPELTSRIKDTFAKTKGNFALAFKDLQTGEEILIDEHRMFHAASTMKTPVMIEVYKQAAAGTFSLSDSVLVKTEFKSIVDSTFSLSPSDDSEPELYTVAGKNRPMSDLVYKMIILSSNLATNILIEYVGAKNVTQSMRDLGANDIQVLRGVEDGKAFRAGLNNQVSAYDLMLIFTAMAKGETVSQQASEEMIKILLDQKFNTIIPAKLPADVKVAHKTGWITGLNHDSGIVFLPDGKKYVLILLSDSVAEEDEKVAVENMATASRLIYDFVIAD